MANQLSSYEPTILVDVLLDGGTRRYATRDFYDGSDNYYKGTLLDGPQIGRALSDLYYGVEQSTSITLRFSNRDNGIDDTWDDIVVTNADEPRGRWVTVQRHDPTDGTTFEFRGKITGYILGPTAQITVEMRDDYVLDTLLPLGVVTTDGFTVTALDVGEPINLCFGHCRNVPLRNIKNDTGGDEYDYLVGYGTLESLWVDHANDMGVKRDGVLVDTGEYTFFDGSGGDYPGYSFIRFTTEQMDFSGGFHRLTADVKGLEMGGAAAERNFADVIGNLLSDATWGLGDSVDAASFTAAAAALDTIGDMYCDGSVTEQRQARDVLDDLLFPARARIERASDGEWEIAIDGTGASVLSLGDNDGLYNNAEVESTSALSTGEALTKAVLHYALDPTNENVPFKEMVATPIHAFGIVKTYEMRFVLEDDTAERVLSYIKNRSLYSDKTATITVGMEGRDLAVGDIVTVTAPTRNLSADEYLIEGISKGLTDFNLECREYSASIFGNLVISSPTAPTARNYPVDGPASWVGPIRLGDGTHDSAQVTMSVAAGQGDVYIAAGTIDTAAWTAAPGFLLGIDDSDGDKAKLFVGDTTSYMSWDGTSFTISVDSANALTVKGGGDINLEAGGDIILAGSDTDPATIEFVTDGANLIMESHKTNDNFSIRSSADADGRLYIGQDFGAAYKRFIQIVATASQDVFLYGRHDANNYGYVQAYGSAGNNFVALHAFDDAAVAQITVKSAAAVQEIICRADYVRPDTTDVTDLGISTKKWKQGWFNDYVIAEGGIHVGGTADPGTDDLIVDGKVGVGTTAPAWLLTIENPTDASMALLRADSSIVLDDLLGHINFAGDDPASDKVGAAIKAYADGEWGTGADPTDFPGRIELMTTPEGSGTLATRMTIKENGNIGINIAAPLAKLHIDQSVDDAAIPVLILDQADISEGFINFIGSDRGVIAGATASVESVRVELGGVVRRLALYADA